jgi:hypothetical protein
MVIPSISGLNWMMQVAFATSAENSSSIFFAVIPPLKRRSRNWDHPQPDRMAGRQMAAGSHSRTDLRRQETIDRGHV